MNAWRATRDTRDFLMMFGPNDPQSDSTDQPARVKFSNTVRPQFRGDLELIRTVIYVDSPIVREEIAHSVREHLPEVVKIDFLDRDDVIARYCGLALYRIATERTARP